MSNCFNPEPPAPTALAEMLRVDGPLTIGTTAEWRVRLLEGMDQQPEPALDLSGTNACDTAGIQLLVSARLIAARQGRRLRLVNPSAAVLRAASALCLEGDLFPTTSDSQL